MRVNPYIEQQINLFDTILKNSGWLRNVAIPAFSLPAGVRDVKDIVPAVRKVIFCKAVSRLKAYITEVFCRVFPVCLDYHAVRQVFDNFALVLDARLAKRIEFDYRYHASCSWTAG